MTIEKILVYEAIKAEFKTTRKLVPTIQQLARVHVYTYLCLKYQCASFGIFCLNDFTF